VSIRLAFFTSGEPWNLFEHSKHNMILWNTWNMDKRSCAAKVRSIFCLLLTSIHGKKNIMSRTGRARRGLQHVHPHASTTHPKHVRQYRPQLSYPHAFFANFTIHRRHSQRTHTHPYEYTHVNLTPRSIFEDNAGKSSRLTKSPQASRCRREGRLPLKAQTPLNPEKFAPIGSRTRDLRCYRGSCNH
jgi:hypothetical protein